MAVSRDEVIKVAALSKLIVDEVEMPRVAKQLSDVLGYAQRVCQFQGAVALVDQRTNNVVRRDESVRADAAPLIAQAPESQENLVVVPKIVHVGKENA